jgi:NADPH-dependent glutamate synthase beta subunit-like oxidoreductase/NAD(P)H-flavin reductase
MADKVPLKDLFNFEDFYCLEGLVKLDQVFLAFIREREEEIYHALLHFRKLEEPLENKALSSFLLTLSPLIEQFIIEVFSIEKDFSYFRSNHKHHSIYAEWRKKFIRKYVINRYTLKECQSFNPLLLESYLGDISNEKTFAHKVLFWLQHKQKFTDQINAAIHYSAWAIYTQEGQEKHQTSVLFKAPHKLDFMNLVPLNRTNNLLEQISPPLKQREGFDLLEPLPSQARVLCEAHYCLQCHSQGKDSCAKGLFKEEKKTFAVSPLGVELTGCPLQQKISEMNFLYTEGKIIAALAVITLDNPMVAATGYRICNDCSKACIFQKQEPVDIPAIESRILKEVLELPWGFEIYSLLTRWNPLNLQRPYPRPPSGYNILVVGQGPAGFTLAHYLLNDGHRVVAIDGLTIHPLDQTLLTKPIRWVKDITLPLEKRPIGGFGGVMEYGITHRWDKNYLHLIRLLLERRQGFTLKGGIRFGSQVTSDSALKNGFDHIALCMGAGQPKTLPLKNATAPGIYMASDFLMGLHLQGFYKKDSIASFDIKPPIIVIGGGLTAVDAATEIKAYYPRFIEKLVHHFQILSPSAQEKFKNSPEGKELFEQIKNDPSAEVTLVYRKDLQQSPAYRLNHKELKSVLEQGVKILENVNPIEVKIDKSGHVKGLKVSHKGKEKILPARTLILAIGTAPYMYEEEELFNKEEKISILGDLDPVFSGSVVKAMASAKKGAIRITRLLSQNRPQARNIAKFIRDLEASVVNIRPLASSITEVTIKAPAAARSFKPGQFFRLQNLSSHLPNTRDSSFLIEPLALTGSWVNPKKGLLSFTIFEEGASSSLCRAFQKGEKISLMGPTGRATEISHHENVLLIGHGLGNAVLLPIGQSLREHQNQVFCIAGYPSHDALFYRKRIETIAEQVIWCWETTPSITSRRAQDLSFQGSVVQALIYFSEKNKINLKSINRIIVIGDVSTLSAIHEAFQTVLKPYLSSTVKSICNVNSLMQCMMKGVCGRCIQRVVDPLTKQEEIVFSCISQEQLITQVDFNCLSKRLKHNRISEKLMSLYVKEILK